VNCWSSRGDGGRVVVGVMTGEECKPVFLFCFRLVAFLVFGVIFLSGV